jgi:hypothetical protein
MQAVGWAVESDEHRGVILPKFFSEHNIPLTGAEKQRAYRERKKGDGGVTKPLPGDGNKLVTRSEKIRSDVSDQFDQADLATDGEIRATCRRLLDAAELPKPELFDWHVATLSASALLPGAGTALDAYRGAAVVGKVKKNKRALIRASLRNACRAPGEPENCKTGVFEGLYHRVPRRHWPSLGGNGKPDASIAEMAGRVGNG